MLGIYAKSMMMATFQDRDTTNPALHAAGSSAFPSRRSYKKSLQKKNLHTPKMRGSVPSVPRDAQSRP